MEHASTKMTDLSIPPDDPVDASGYSELYELWSELNAAVAGTGLSTVRFAAWDGEAMAMLTKEERARFTKPLRPTIPIDSGTIQYARHMHLTKILWARKGLEKLMTDTGY